jgi:MoaD family protein
MKIRVKYFLWLSEKAGVEAEELELPSKFTLRQLLLELGNRRPRLSKIIQELLVGSSEIIILLNSKTPPQGLETPLKDLDEVAFMPPLSGG